MRKDDKKNNIDERRLAGYEFHLRAAKAPATKRGTMNVIDTSY